MIEKRKKKGLLTFLKENDGKITLGIIFLFVCLAIIYSKINEEEYYKEINNYQNKTIGKVYSIRIGKHSYLKYYFHYNNKKYFSEAKYSKYSHDNFEKFYFVIFNNNNPDKSHIYLNEEIQPDSITLTKAGFKFVPYYIHDIRSNTYKEKHKWE